MMLYNYTSNDTITTTQPVILIHNTHYDANLQHTLWYSYNDASRDANSTKQQHTQLIKISLSNRVSLAIIWHQNFVHIACKT
jgi:hypothetical protein